MDPELQKREGGLLDTTRLGRRAVDLGYVSEERLRECLQEQERSAAKAPLGQILLRKRYLTAEQLVEVLGEGGEGSGGLSLPSRYRVLQELGRGATGTVYLAEDRKLKRPVAVKILDEGYAGSEDARRRFEVEAQVLARLNHRGIVQVHDAGRAGKTLYLVMEYVNGRSLGDFYRKGEHGFRVAAEVVAQAAEAVQHAHEQGVVHRDLKPANMLVEEGAEGARVKVTDFGLARDSATTGTLTATGMILGTPCYMAPEQVAGRRVEGRTDVWGLGAVLYFLLTGRPPFVGQNEYEVFSRILSEEAEAPRRIDAKVPRDLELVCMKALMKEVEERYETAAHLAEDLRRWLGGEAVEAQPPSWTRWVRGKARRHRGKAAVGLVAAGVLVVGVQWWVQRGEAQGWAREAGEKYRAGRIEEAKALWDRARGRIGIDEAAYAECAAKVEEKRRKAEALVEEERVFGPIRKKMEYLPNTTEGIRRRIELLDRGLEQYEPSWDAWLQKGECHHQVRELDLALKAYARSLEIRPGLAMAHYRMGLLLLKEFDRKDEALREFEKALEQDPDNEYAKVGRAWVYVLRGEFAKGALLCDELEPHGKYLAELHYLRGVLHATEEASGFHDLSRAVDSFSRTIAIEPNGFPAAYSNRGACRRQLGDLAGAQEDFRRSIEINPENPAVYFNRGILKVEQGDVRGAIEDYTEAIRREPKYSKSYGNRGTARGRIGDLDGAIADFRKELELDPGSDTAWFNLGFAYEKKKDPEKARECFTKSLERNPGDGKSWLHRGGIRFNDFDYEGAVEDLTRAVELLPKEVAAWYIRGRAFESLERFEEASRDYERALDLASPNWAQRGEVEKRLSSCHKKIRH